MYTSPTWTDGTSPALSAANLQAMTDQIEDNQRLYGTVDPTSATQGALGQTYANTQTSNVFVCVKATSPYVWYSLTNPKWYQLGSYTSTASTSGSITLSLTDYLDYYKAVFIYLTAKKTGSTTSTISVRLGNSSSGAVIFSRGLYSTTTLVEQVERPTITASSTYANLQTFYYDWYTGASGTMSYPVAKGDVISDWHYNQVYLYNQSSAALQSGLVMEVYGLR